MYAFLETVGSAIYDFLEIIALAVVNFFAGLRTDQFMDSLGYMAYGMGGIFIVVLIIVLSIVILNKLPAGKGENQ